MASSTIPRPGLGWLLRPLAAFIGLLSLWFMIGGIILLTVSGSSYYLLAGIALLFSAVQLWRRKISGALGFAGVLIATLLWTMWETGANYWGWVPRMGLLTLIAFIVTLILPTLDRGPTRKFAMCFSGLIAAILLVGVALAFQPHGYVAPTGPIPDEPIPGMSTASNSIAADWKNYGGDGNANRYSPLAQITPANISNLETAWTFRTGSMPADLKNNRWAPETTPIKVGDGIYLCSATNDMMRVDPATGKEVWHYKSNVTEKDIPYTAACRGVTYYESAKIPVGQGCHSRILEGTLNMKLITVDAETGKPCPGFGEDGKVDLWTGMGKVIPGMAAVTAPPPVVNGVIVVNQQVMDGQRRWSPSGVIRGYDAETGAFLWAWDVNRPGKRGLPGPGETYSKGTPNSWTTMTGDPKLGLVYVPTGNSTVDYYSAMRTPQENAVSTSVVALDVKTGEKRWIFQTVHKDAWDYDMGSQVTLLDYPDAKGRATPAMIVPTKRGQTFILDRRNGKPLTPVVERPAPAGNVPGDPRAPTQPWSIGMPEMSGPKLTEAKMWGMTPLDQLYCRIKFRDSRYLGEFTPPGVGDHWIVYPGFNGGNDWGSTSYDPHRGILVANYSNLPVRERLIPRAEADKMGLRSMDDPAYKPGGTPVEGNGPQADTPYAIETSILMVKLTNMLCNEPPYGKVMAIDMHTRKTLWERPLGTARANGPFNIPTGLPIEIGTPNNGGPMMTGSGLVFIAAAMDNLLRAIDIRTGKVVWSTVLPAGGQATPMTYEHKGRQYVLMMAGGHHVMGTPTADYLVAYALKR
ncbi:membrane-bound PQQ-dependent dehydrogenase, glucose/quinate/shikimate family [Sphingobium sp. YR768]|uniref:membrane-bound PQQ-dependent dehydrogenase, glucose/quinate/shikimate family n=1 Tax=Sphingobium sp. YR768 TaxID=1884365 RepID=UPI0008BCADF7|nr:membrane-bound PQQ-dependent dehydrogenase, glucose/quinate/shikimate family [Sphingobium sp. YR768]SER31131.1 quinoprotein glucose dehydrogenase [Sphingobium sp. YR768]